MPGTHLLVASHPSPASLCARIAALAAGTLAARGRPVAVDDLYRIGFNPAVSEDELRTYLDARVPEDIAGLVDNLRAAEHLIFVLPLWMYGVPALLKGYFDRVWRPHVTFEIDGDRIRPLLTNVRRLTAIVTHGMRKEASERSGDGSRLLFSKSLPSVLPNLEHNTRFDLYGLDTASADDIKRDLDRIEQHFASL